MKRFYRYESKDIPNLSKEIWDIINSGLQSESCDYGVLEIDSWLSDGYAQLWVLTDGKKPISIVITTVEKTSKAKYINVLLVAGEKDYNDWEIIEKTLCDSAKDINCDYIEYIGRNGFMRLLNQFGWKENAIVARKVLNG